MLIPEPLWSIVLLFIVVGASLAAFMIVDKVTSTPNMFSLFAKIVIAAVGLYGLYVVMLRLL